ncbi:hypothetical protein ABZZ79_03030 [Streptomyces sp. NPDC006458]|uniref:hypothetical protein n=1 Tax=Streptomyces sp. NPDC006458 TaxID=3154302 RepID=UPI0033AD5B15
MRIRHTAAIALLASALTACSASSTDDNADAPAYKVVTQDASGNKRNVVVEVDTAKGLRAVFDAVVGDLTDEAGYYIMINCSTGGTADLDNRLANGQKAIGRMGAATTGLEEGGTEFSTNDGRTCPVSAAEQAKKKAALEAAATAAGIPPEPTGVDRQALLDTLAAAAPDVVRYEDKAVGAARNQCSAINGDANKLDWLASQRFTYRDVVTTEEQGAKLNAALKASGFCKV